MKIRRALAAVALATLLAGGAIAARLDKAPAASSEDVPVFRIVVPDCGKVLCVVPEPVLKGWFDEMAAMHDENERLRAELAEAKKSKKCAKLEVTS